MTSSGWRLTTCLAVLAGCLVAPVLPASARDEPVAAVYRPVPESSGMAARDVALDAPLLGRPLRTEDVDLVGLTWHGPSGAIRVRTRSDGRWTGWRPATVLDEAPDGGSRESSQVVGTELLWVDDADRVEVDVQGLRPDRLTLVLMDVSQVAPAVERSARPAISLNEFRPRVFGRDAWRADPRLRSGRPSYNRTIQQVHVHHTVDSNDYAAGDVRGLIRGIYRYHTVNLGWSDIGYNFLIDRFGRTWVGRAGGFKLPVRGAHTLGFNSTSTGVALIGNFEISRPSRKARTALVHLAAWKLDKYDRHPLGKVKVFSHGSDLFRFGRRVRLPVIDGHRDTNQTACPGQQLYERLPDLRRRVAERITRYRGKPGS